MKKQLHSWWAGRHFKLSCLDLSVFTTKLWQKPSEQNLKRSKKKPWLDYNKFLHGVCCAVRVTDCSVCWLAAYVVGVSECCRRSAVFSRDRVCCKFGIVWRKLLWNVIKLIKYFLLIIWRNYTLITLETNSVIPHQVHIYEKSSMQSLVITG